MRSIIGDLSQSGFALLPGWGFWFDTLSPIKRPEAWAALCHPHTVSLLKNHTMQIGHFTLNDEGGIDEPAQLTVAVSIKEEKSHLTIVEGGDWISGSPLLPLSVRSYLADLFSFQRAMRSYFDEVVPRTEFPTKVQCRVFHYLPSDPLAAFRRDFEAHPAMRNHVDGTVVTVVVADSSDRALRCYANGRWETIARADGKPFAVGFPGSAAAHDFDLPPIPHLVLPCCEPRVSIVTRLAPDLGTLSIDLAKNRLAKWRIRRA